MLTVIVFFGSRSLKFLCRHLFDRTVDIADGTAEQMYMQREQLESASRNVSNTQHLTKEAQKKITDLQRRMRMEKVLPQYSKLGQKCARYSKFTCPYALLFVIQVILWIIIAVLIVINCFLVYRLITNHGHL